MNLLIVDDSAVMRKIIARAVRHAGLKPGSVMEAGNGIEALEILKSNRIDLVFCDVNMPVMDGMEFLRRKRAFSSVPVVMVTSENRCRYVAQEAGAAGFLPKPFTISAMEGLLDRLPRRGAPCN